MWISSGLLWIQLENTETRKLFRVGLVFIPFYTYGTRPACEESGAQHNDLSVRIIRVAKMHRLRIQAPGWDSQLTDGHETH